MHRRHFLQACAAHGALALPCVHAHSAGPVTIAFPFAAGASGDTNIRLITQTVTDLLGPKFVIDNKPGANGIIAAEMVKRAAPDGQTLYVANVGSHAINAPLYGHKLPYRIQEDFAPITLLWQFPCVLAVPAHSSARTLEQFLQLQQQSPEGLTFASAGKGSGGHLLAELLAHATQRPYVHVPYKGAAPAVQDLLAGRVDAFFVSYSSIKAQVQAGKLHVLAVAGPQRLAALPQVPTLPEKGLPSVHMVNWFGLVAPAGTPADKIAQLATQFQQAVAQPAVVQRLAADGIEAVSTTPAAFHTLIAAEIQRYTRLVAGLNLQED